MQQKILLSHSFNGLSFISLIEKTMAFFFHGNSHKNQSTKVNIDDHVVKRGNLTKKKNMKTRYYVLKSESDDLPARLECYESEKKFIDGSQPKKKYILKDCFNISNISRKTDKNDQHIIALYINKDCIGLLAENEEEMQDWVKLLKLHKNSNLHNPNLKIEYEHVWQVEVLPRSLALNQDLTGQHFLCLTNWFLSLVRVNDPSIKKEFELSAIRKCGTYDQFFLLVLGRYSGIGSGELFLQTEDSFIAQNIYHSVCSAMSNFGRMLRSSDGNIRQRTISDPQADFPVGEGRVRADSVPSGRKNLPNRKGHTCPSLEMIQQQPHETPDNIRFSSRLEELLNQMPDRNASETGDMSKYLMMEGIANSSVTSPRGTLGEPLGDSDVYVEFPKGEESGERHAPTYLNIPSRTNPPSHTEVLSNVCSALQGMSSPVSPSVGSMTQWRTSSVGTPSPSQTSSAAHSRNASLLDESYVDMTSPGSQGPQILAKSGTSSQYLEMGPGPTTNITQAERPRSISTPTPIPSPSDEDSCEIFNSGSSSCASGTPSDTRIHDIAGEERGDTPHSCGGLWGNSLSPNYMEDNDSVGGPRPLRTNSVGSKPEQFKRKNRLDGAVPVGDSARVRAFSVGSRVSLKLGVGRHGCGSAHHGAEHPTGGLGEIFPSIKECGKQAKSKSSSAPMLGASPISHSWSGTPGAHFRGFLQSRNALRESNLMELDFSKNRSCDYIPSEDKDKERKTSKERLWHTFTGHRHRSNSKSSGGSNQGVKEKRTSESENSSRGLDIPYMPNDRNDYLELDFTPSPRSSNSDHMKGYLPMHPPHLSSSLKTTSEFIIEKRGPRTSSFNEGGHDMSSSLSSCASNDGYVDMTRGGATNGGLTIASSSSSSNSINTPPIGGGGSRPRRTSSGIYTSVMSSQELPSPMEDFVKGEEIEAVLGELKKSKKKGSSKRRSFRDSSKKKKNDSGGGDSPEIQNKSKSQGPFATLTNLIIRKPNSSSNASSSTHKTPLSPKGSPLPPKVNKDSSPFSSLTRSKSKGKDLFSEIGEERESSSLSEDITASSSPPPLSPQNSLRRRTLGGLEISPIPPYPVQKGEEKMLLSPLEGKLIRQCSTNSEATTEEKRKSAYVNMDNVTCSAGSLPSLNLIQKGVTITTKPLNFVESRNYVNMQPGSSSPQLSPPATDSSSPKPSFENLKLTVVTKPPPTDNYMMMGGVEQVKETHVPSLPSAVAKRPEIPPTLLSNHSHQQRPVTLAAFEKLSLKEEKPLATGVSTERSRSHSGPGAPEGTKGIILKKADDGRASSACSSPISYSPPTSPTLGSVSSMSSLSEGGLSSASSTCTVVNVGLKHSSSTSNASKSSSLSTTTIVTTNTTASLTTTTTSIASSVTSGTSQPSSAPEPSTSTSCSLSDSQKQSSSLSATKTVPTAAAVTSSQAAKSSNEDESLNYVALDLGNNRSNKSPSPRLASKNFYSAKKSNSDDVPLSYVEIDFKKSEGLRNTSLERDLKRPH